MNLAPRLLVPLLIAIVLAVGGPWLYGQLRSLPGAHDLGARSGQRIVTLEVGGMHCDACVASVRANLTTVKGVSAVEVRLAQKRAYVVCDPAVADTVLTSAVHAAGPGFFGQVVEK